MISLKPGVRILGLRPELILSIVIANEIWAKQGAELVITSVIDGAHSRGSEHYTGLAWDGRTRDLKEPRVAVEELATRLGPDYDVIFEGEGTPNAHAHVEYDPKEPL